MTLEQKLKEFKREFNLDLDKDNSDPIPKIVKLLENPSSPLALPGEIDLYNHDCLHVLLDKDISAEGEAFVVGFCMGNDPDTKWIHVLIFKFFSLYIYPHTYRLNFKQLSDFDSGFDYGRSLTVKRINKVDFSVLNNYSVASLRQIWGISKSDLDLIAIKNQKRKHSFLSSFSHKIISGEVLRWSSSIFAVVGGFILALNIKISAYGFIMLAMSSGQLLISSLITKDVSLIIYSGSVFIFVDLLGIYRWLIIG